MHLVNLLSLGLMCLYSSTLAEQPLPLEPGSCSQKCENSANQTNATAEKLLPCSCSSSCSVYKDCCFDSQHRNKDGSATSTSRMCISLSTRGRFLVISGCPSSWSGSSNFCSESIGHLPPVTSTTSGMTYANLYCAICNGDGEKLTTWNVELRCCSEHEYLEGRRYVYRRGHLWSKVDNHGKCLCHYESHYHDTSFADHLELRSCDRSLEISRCSYSWRDDAVKELCSSFLDPLYIGERIYRNIYCGQCNYERLDRVKCIPTVVERKLSEGSDMPSIFEYCTSHHLTTCLHYLDHLHRGKSYTFSSLLNIREESCIPPAGRRCCEGFRYDFRAKRCRQIVKSNKSRINL
ncbi:hypothetical protein AVEN_190165-1 [Araneus ventricosus]|uniref:SMB domain-containing protein n=1 Tax=Araneus ventricosus TaxID=182803 RepID=A0A4Y2SMB4_ARAVE|nr:hypothetical protein AVEN_190165-1 [Araneus ventricosus]